MSFSGQEVTDKGFAKGWDPNRQDQASQREFRNVQILEAAVFRTWAWRPHDSLGLKYAYYGGYVDGGSEWTLVADGTVTLADNAVNYVERSTAGVVSVNQVGFTYPSLLPMAVIRTANGSLLPNTYVDSRLLAVTSGGGGGGGVVTFEQIVGQILASQVPLSVVAQHQYNLCINALQIKPGTFGAGASCNPSGTGDYGFPRDLAIGQDLAVARDLSVAEDADVVEQLRRGQSTVTAIQSPYTWLSSDWHINADTTAGEVIVQIPDAAVHHVGGRTDQIHVKKIGTNAKPVRLQPAVAGQLIDRCSEAIIRQPMRSYTLVSDGNDWWIQ